MIDEFHWIIRKKRVQERWHRLFIFIQSVNIRNHILLVLSHLEVSSRTLHGRILITRSAGHLESQVVYNNMIIQRPLLPQT
jgi:hypothetical protein